MSVTLGDAVTYLTADDKDLNAGLKRADGKIRKFSKGAQKVLGTALKMGMLAAAAGIAAGIGLVAKSVFDAADAGEAMAKFDATFGAASGGLIRTLDEVAAATGRSRYELRESAADFGAVTKALGFTEQGAADMSAQALQMAVDLGAFHNLPTADVAKRIRKALTGETESMKELGVVVSANRIKQELLNMGYEDNLQTISETVKAQAIFNIIQRQTTDAVGIAAEEAGSFTGQMVGLKAQFKDFMIDMGTKFLPAITPVITAIGEKLPEAFAWVLEKVDKFMGVFEYFRWQLADGKTPIEALTGVLRALVPPELREKLDGIIAGFTKLSEWVAAHKDEIIAGFAAIGAVVLISLVPPFVAWAIATAAALLPIVAIGVAVGLLVAAWKTDFGGIRTFLEPIFEKIKGWWDDLMESVGGVSGAFEIVVEWIRKFIEKLKNIKIPKGLQAVIDALSGKSPSPLEMGIRGAAEAFGKELSPQLGKFAMQLQGAGSTTDARDYSRTTRVDQMNIFNGRDEQAIMQMMRNWSRG